MISEFVRLRHGDVLASKNVRIELMFFDFRLDPVILHSSCKMEESPDCPFLSYPTDSICPATLRPEEVATLQCLASALVALEVQASELEAGQECPNLRTNLLTHRQQVVFESKIEFKKN